MLAPQTATRTEASCQSPSSSPTSSRDDERTIVSFFISCSFDLRRVCVTAGRGIITGTDERSVSTVIRHSPRAFWVTLCNICVPVSLPFSLLDAKAALKSPTCRQTSSSSPKHLFDSMKLFLFFLLFLLPCADTLHLPVSARVRADAPSEAERLSDAAV